MSAILFPNGKQYYALPSGAPNVGGKVYTYAAGTSTPQVTWTDAAQAVPNTNPVILDARGEALIFWDGSYKVVLTDLNDNIIWTVDNITATPADNSLRGELAAHSPAGASLIGLYPSGTLDDAVTWYTPQMFGALANDSANDTAAISAAIAALPAGGTLRFPPGTYMTDYHSGIAKEVHFILDDGATIKQRLPDNPATTLNPVNNLYWGIFEFVAGAEGSTVRGGTIDGNRDVLAPYYPATTRLGLDPHWWGIRVNYCNDVTLEDITFRNIMQEAFYAYGGERFTGREIRVYDSGVAFAAQGSLDWSSGYEVDVYAEGIGNIVGGVGYYFFQHGSTFGYLKDSSLIVEIKNFYGTKGGTDGVATGGGKEPVPIAVNMFAYKNCNVVAEANRYTAPTALAGQHQAFNFSSVYSSMIALTSFDHECGLVAGTALNCDITLDLDGNYRAVAGFAVSGLLVTFGGVFTVVGAGLAGETNANNTTNNTTFRGRVRRFGIGVRDEGADVTYAPGFDCSGNVTDGFQLVGPTGSSGSYPVARTRPNGGRSLIGIRSRFNGQTGVIYTRGDNDQVIDSDLRDNGQQTGVRVGPYAVWVLAESGQGNKLRIADNNVEGTLGTTDTNGFTYIPGTATAVSSGYRYDLNTVMTHQYQVIARNPNYWHVGQFITVAGQTGRIIDISADILTMVFSSAVVFPATLVNLTGTGTTSGTALTGVGTLFTTEVDTPLYLKSGTEYRRIVYVTSNTTAIIDSPFSVNLSGAVLQVVKANGVSGVYVPTQSVVVNDQVTVGPLLLRDNRSKNVFASINTASFSGLDVGSRFEIAASLAMAGTGLVNNILAGLPGWCQVQNVKVRFDTNITGPVAANCTIQIRHLGANLKTAIPSIASLGIGAVNYGPAPDAPAFPTVTGGEVAFVSTAVNPTGTLTAWVTLEKFSWVG